MKDETDNCKRQSAVGYRRAAFGEREYNREALGGRSSDRAEANVFPVSGSEAAPKNACAWSAGFLPAHLWRRTKLRREEGGPSPPKGKQDRMYGRARSRVRVRWATRRPGADDSYVSTCQRISIRARGRRFLEV